MSKPTFCNTCIFYEKDIFTRAGGEKFGICKNISVSMKLTVDGEAKMTEDNTIYTEQYFGCVYWRNNAGVLIDINAVVEKVVDLNADIVCQSCGADNCANNKTCIKCNCQL